MADTFDIMDFADCTPLVNDVEWDETLEALQASLKEKNTQNHKIVQAGPVNIASNNLSILGPENDDAEPAPQADTCHPSQHANLATLAEVCKSELTRLVNIASPSKASESNLDKLANLAIVATASESESTVLGNSAALGEASVSELTNRINPPKQRRANRKEFQLPSGWIEMPVVRKGGKSAGRVDKFYLELNTGKRCRSRVELQHYLSSLRRDEENRQ